MREEEYCEGLRVRVIVYESLKSMQTEGELSTNSSRVKTDCNHTLQYTVYYVLYTVHYNQLTCVSDSTVVLSM